MGSAVLIASSPLWMPCRQPGQVFDGGDSKIPVGRSDLYWRFLQEASNSAEEAAEENRLTMRNTVSDQSRQSGTAEFFADEIDTSSVEAIAECIDNSKDADIPDGCFTLGWGRGRFAVLEFLNSKAIAYMDLLLDQRQVCSSPPVAPRACNPQ